jgi:hypothetical protein
MLLLHEIVSANYVETKGYKGTGMTTANFDNNFNGNVIR